MDPVYRVNYFSVGRRFAASVGVRHDGHFRHGGRSRAFIVTTKKFGLKRLDVRVHGRLLGLQTRQLDFQVRHLPSIGTGPQGRQLDTQIRHLGSQGRHLPSAGTGTDLQGHHLSSQGSHLDSQGLHLPIDGTGPLARLVIITLVVGVVVGVVVVVVTVSKIGPKLLEFPVRNRQVGSRGRQLDSRIRQLESQSRSLAGARAGSTKGDGPEPPQRGCQGPHK